MDAINFAYWLQGLLELSPDIKTLDENQVKMIREHLQLVFVNVTGTKVAPTQPYYPGIGQGTGTYTTLPTAPTIYCYTDASTKSDSSTTKALHPLFDLKTPGDGLRC